MNLIVVIEMLLITITVSADYWHDREEFIKLDASYAIGSSIVLTAKEKKVNEILMNYKFQEYDQGFQEPQSFLPAQHFFHSKNDIQKSKVFKFIQKVAKGASLHSHDTALVSFEYVYNLTYKDNLYGCIVNNRLLLHFFGDRTTKDCEWKLVKDLREKNSTFDDFIKSQISIVVKDPVKRYPDTPEVWSTFVKTFNTVNGLVCYRPVFEDYFYQALQELFDDNVMYLEFRGVLPTVYELNGTSYGPVDIVKFYKDTLQKFKRDNPRFHDARFIYAPTRSVDNKTAEEYVTIARKLKQVYPDFVIGFDLVGEEEMGKPLRDFVPELLELSKEGMKFFFHAGETNWNGVSTDLNLVDAILLNTTRIGHGFGIVKHPEVLKIVKERQIAIEISPISNQVLKLVDDLRNHPGNFLIAGGYPVVITCDDPSFWGAKALSYDWYMAFMGLASREADLRLLKQLAINSLNYSALAAKEKSDVLTKFYRNWKQFLDFMLETHQEFGASVYMINK